DQLVEIDPVADAQDQDYGNCAPFEGGCCAIVSTLAEHGQWARSADASVRCGYVRTPAEAAFALGDFPRAASFLDREKYDFESDVHAARSYLLAGDLEGAARATRRFVLYFSENGFEGKADITALPCLADALDGRRGDGGAIERLKEKQSASKECS